MMIVVTGNIASGKSTLAQKIAKATSYKLLSIDKYRKRYGDGTHIGEAIAWGKLLDQLDKGIDCVLEMTGTGQYYELSLLRYPGRYTVIYLSTDVNTCIANHNRRLKQGYKLPPIGWSRNMTSAIKKVGKLVKYIDHDIATDGKMNQIEVDQWIKQNILSR